jgi:hypothetical protein
MEKTMRFNVIWLADDGFAEYAEHFEHPNFEKARRFCASKLIRETVDPGIVGFLLTYADSEFIRRYTTTPGSSAKRTTERCEIAIACKNMPHLIRRQ